MDARSPIPSSARELLLGSAQAYDDAADLELVRRIGALAWLLTATLAAVMLGIWPPSQAVGSAGWAVAGGGVAGLAAAAVAGHRMRRISLRVSLAVSAASILLLGALQWLAGPQSHYAILIAIPLLFIGASQAPRRVALAAALGGFADLVAVLDGRVTAGSVTVAAVNLIIWLTMGALAVVWTSGVRWQRIALRREQSQAHHLALHDTITGLGNRRKLMADLEEAARRDQPAVLALFDLNGFKAYNDSFGHPAGDALLARLGASLTQRAVGLATAYRMGGDEFCLLAVGEAARGLDLVELGCEALRERGPGFLIHAAGGAASIPDEASDPVDALRLADGRMYAHKQERRGRAVRDGADMLLAVLQERDPALAEHAESVARLAEGIAQRLGVPEPEMAQLVRAAQLHDIGKLAIPDAILHKPGPLTEGEWEFIRRHTVIGQRIVGSSPELAAVGEIIRSSHERIDGGGYPDALVGSDIPLTARIVAACDAYDAMTSERPHRPAMTRDDAVAELRRQAGRRFDGLVVEALAEIVGREDVAPAQPGAAAAA
jgi:diguanylate cyclase (GGDEF)-like protein